MSCATIAATWNVGVDPAELAVVDERLADRRLGDVVDRQRGVGHQLLHQEEPIASSGSAGRRERDEEVARAPRSASRTIDHRTDTEARVDARSPPRAPASERGRRPRRRCRYAPAPGRAPRSRTGTTSRRRCPTGRPSPSGRRRTRAGSGRGGRAAGRSRSRRSTGSRSASGGGGASSARMVPSRTRRDDEADRVERDRDRGGQDLDEEAADAERGELGHRPGGRQGAVRRDKLLARDDRRQVGVVGDVEERGQDRRQGGDDQQLRERQEPPKANATGIGRSSAARPRSAQIMTGRRRRRSTHAPATRPNDERRRSSSSAAQERDVDRPGAEHEDGHERQRDPGDEDAEDRDRRRRPDADERRVAPERGGERVAHGRRA